MLSKGAGSGQIERKENFHLKQLPLTLRVASLEREVAKSVSLRHNNND